MKSKTAIYWLILFLVPVGILGYAALEYFQNAANNTATDRAKANQESGGRSSITYPGFVDAREGNSRITSIKIDRVIHIPVEENSKVKKGEELIILDDRVSKFLVKEAKAAMALAETQLETARQNLERVPLKLEQQEKHVAALSAAVSQAKSNLGIATKRLELRQITPEELSVAKAKLDQAIQLFEIEKSKWRELKLLDGKLELEVARIQVEQAKIKVQRAEMDLQNCVLRAPCDGTVVRILSHVGELVGPTVASLEFRPKSELLVRLKVEQIHLDRIAVGNAVAIRDYHDRQKIWTGKIEQIADSFSRGSQTLKGSLGLSDVRVVECIASLTSKPGSLRIGQRVWVEIKE